MPKLSSILKQDWLIVILILSGFALGAYFYPSLPDKVPTHWNMNGEVDGYGSKLVIIAVISIVPIGYSYIAYQQIVKD